MIKLTDKQTQFIKQAIAGAASTSPLKSVAQTANEALELLHAAELAREVPRFQHDCHACTFLGRRHDLQMGEVDLYHCMQLESIPTIIVRYGDNGPDYQSGRHMETPSFAEARRRANALRLED